MPVDLSSAVRLYTYDAIKKLYDRMAYNRDADVLLSNAGVDGYDCLAYYLSKAGETWYLLAREKSA